MFGEGDAKPSSYCWLVASARLRVPPQSCEFSQAGCLVQVHCVREGDDILQEMQQAQMLGAEYLEQKPGCPGEMQ